jgi:hypothetical protein
VLAMKRRRKFGCLNDLDIGADGTIYFTEASRKFPMSQFTNDCSSTSLTVVAGTRIRRRKTPRRSCGIFTLRMALRESGSTFVLVAKPEYEFVASG